MKIFDYDSGFMRTVTVLSRLTLLNMLWLISCIPVITAGASTAAMHYSAFQLRDGDIHVFQNFKKGIALHWKRSSIIWIFQAALTAAFIVLSIIIYHSDIPSGTVLIAVAGLAFLTMILVSLWVDPVMIQFAGTLREILFNAFVFAFMYAPLTLIVAAFYIAAGFLAVRYLLARGFFILVGPALIVYATLIIFDKAFQKYKEPA